MMWHPDKPGRHNLGISQETRFGRIGKLADLENAIFNQQRAVKLTDDGHPAKPMYLNNLVKPRNSFGHLTSWRSRECYFQST